jgi:hypothetical protein
MDPVSQVLAQQHSGSAEGEGFGQFYAQGRQLAQQDEQLSLSKQRLRLEEAQEQRLTREADALLPLRKQMLATQAVNLGIEAVTSIQKAQALAEMNAALPEIYQLQSEIMMSPKGGSDPTLRDRAYGLAKRYSRAFINGPGAELLQQVDAAPMWDARLKRVLEAEEKLKQSGLYPRSIDNKGQIDIGLRTDDIRREEIGLRKQALEIQRRRAELAGDNAGLRAIDLQLKGLEAGYDVSGMLPTREQPAAPAQTGNVDTEAMVGSATPQSAAPAQPQAAPRRVERPPTQAVVTQLQKDSLAADTALDRLTNLESTIRANPDAFGVVGIGKEQLESVLGQINPNLDPRISKARHEAGLTFVEIADSLRTDTGNMSLYEQQRLKELGDTRQWRDYPARALSKAETIKKMVLAKKLRALKALSSKPNEALLLQIPSSEWQGLLRSGLLTREDIERAYQTRVRSNTE